MCNIKKSCKNNLTFQCLINKNNTILVPLLKVSLFWTKVKNEELLLKISLQVGHILLNNFRALTFVFNCPKFSQCANQYAEPVILSDIFRLYPRFGLLLHKSVTVSNTYPKY